MKLVNNSLICVKKHCFDLSKLGYINFINKNIKNIYDKNLFNNRREVFKYGLFDKVVLEIKNILLEMNLEKINILDIGCGEGYYSARLLEDEDLKGKINIFGIDLSKDAVELATRYNVPANWCVADLTNIPIKNHSIDVILDILTPSNYNEFKRVLKKNGIIIKIIPGNMYLKEIRDCIKEQIINKEYSSDRVKDYLDKNLILKEQRSILYDFPVNIEQVKNIAYMTPMTSKIDINNINFDNINSVTVHYEILICS
jgi:23S rRNA (guanine745-N1)-methyltransferase